jgi:hypothetical protein
MRRGVVGVCLLFCAWGCAHGAFEPQAAGSRLSALGGTGVGLSGDLRAARVNPAACAGLRHVECAWDVTPGLFGFPEMRRFEVAAGIPWGTAVIPLFVSQFGSDLYREWRESTGAGLLVTPALRVGFLLHGCHLSIRGYGSAWSVALDAGLQWDPIPELTVGCAAANLHGAKIGASGDPLPRSLSAGIHFHPVEEGRLLLDIVKEPRFPAEIHVGMEYTLLNLLALRCGLVNDPSLLTGGIGVHWQMLEADYALTLHDVLGETHQFGLRIRLGGA